MTIFGTTGDDRLDVALLSSGDAGAHVDAARGADRVRGAGAGDLLCGRQGRDRLDGGGGADSLRGGGGDDILVLDPGVAGTTRFVNGGGGDDTLVLRLDAASAADPGILAEIDRVEAAMAADPAAIVESALLGLRVRGVEHLATTGHPVPSTPIEQAAAHGQGLRIRGEQPGDLAGYSVAGVGDVNGDGLDDLLVGAKNQEVDRALSNSGAAYVVFGRKAGGSIDLRDIAAGHGGFKIQGYREGETAGAAVAGAGDVNGDGLADLLVGVPSHRGLDNSFPGAAYVIFGKADTETVRLGDIARLDQGGFLIRGEARFDQAGLAVAGVGDVDGDGLDDVLIGAVAGDGPPGATGPTGAAYVVFGKADGASVRLADVVASGTGGFKIVGEAGDDQAGIAVAAAGDLNGDGHADYLVGAERNAPAGGTPRGAAYIVFGTAAHDTIELADVAQGIGGIKIIGERSGDFVGAALAVADVNGDGANDVLIGAYGFDGAAGTSTGAVYVVFGGDWSGPVQLADVAAGLGGFRIDGAARFDSAGISVAAAGDLNGDGLTDLLVGAEGRERGVQIDAGAAYVVFGKADGAPVHLADVAAGIGGFELTGKLEEDAAGFAVSAAGDVNGDGLDDLVVGAPFADGANRIDSGTAYVLFGRLDWLLA